MKSAQSGPFSAHLFLGLRIDDTLQHLLNQSDPNLRSVYIQENDLYLQELFHISEKYLGKRISGIIDLPALQLLQNNIESLIKILIPHFEEQGTCVLLGINE